MPLQVIVEVTDSGVGMDQETQARLFEKFYQGESSRQFFWERAGALSLVKNR